MTPKEKAKELVEKFTFASIYFANGYDGALLNAKTCALIVVDEIIKTFRKDLPEIGLGKGFWYNVKQEIEKL